MDHDGVISLLEKRQGYVISHFGKRVFFAMKQQGMNSTLTGSNYVDVFLQELTDYLRQMPDHTITDAPEEIVKSVCVSTTRLSGCTDQTVYNSLPRQLCMAVERKGKRFGLSVRRFGGRQLQVSLS